MDTSLDVSRRISRILKVLFEASPLAYAAIAEYDVILTEEIDTAATDGLRVFVNPNFASMLSDDKLALLLLHEALHALFMHPPRAHDAIKLLESMGFAVTHEDANIAADAIVDKYMRQIVKRGNDSISRGGVTLEQLAESLGVDKNVLERMSLEDMLVFFASKASKRGTSVSLHKLLTLQPPLSDLISVEQGDSLEHGGRIVHEGRLSKSGLYQSVRGLIEAGEYDRAAQIIASMVYSMANIVENIAKSADEGQYRGLPPGVGSLGAWRVVEELSRGRLMCEKIINRVSAQLPQAFARVRRTWSRLNKKIPELRPGAILEAKIAKLIAIVDVSGSIDDNELRWFVGCVAQALRVFNPRRAHVIYFEYGVTRVIEGSCVNVLRALREGAPGGGGTSISQALQYATDRASRGAVVLIASDFYTLEDANTLAELMSKLKARAGLIIAIAPPWYNEAVLEPLYSQKLIDAKIVLPIEDPFRRAAV